MDSVPLKLTSREQSFLAELCHVLRTRLYELETGKDPSKDAEDLDEIMYRFCLTPQKLDGLYDRLHRTGSNA